MVPRPNMAPTSSARSASSVKTAKRVSARPSASIALRTTTWCSAWAATCHRRQWSRHLTLTPQLQHYLIRNFPGDKHFWEGKEQEKASVGMSSGKDSTVKQVLKSTDSEEGYRRKLVRAFYLRKMGNTDDLGCSAGAA